MSMEFRRFRRPQTILQTILLIGISALSCWLALASFDIVPPIHTGSPDISSPGLIWLIFEHVLIGFILFAGVLGSGLAILSFVPATWQLTPIDHKLLALPIGLTFWLILCVSVRLADGSSWLIVLLAYAASAIRFNGICRSLACGDENFLTIRTRASWLGHATLLILGIAFSTYFGLLWRYPSIYATGTVDLGDVGCYTAFYHSLKVSVVPFLSLTVEGDAFGSYYFNQITSFLAFAFDGLPGFEFSLFLTTSTSFFFFLGVCFGIQQLLQYRRDQGATKLDGKWICAIVVTICAATRYPSWIVESPPFAFAIPLALPLVYLAARGRERIGFYYVLLPLTVLTFAISKVVMVTIFGAYAFCCFWQAARERRSKAALGILVAGASIIAAFSVYMLVTYGPGFLAVASSADFGPPSLNFLYHKIVVQHARVLKAIYKALPNLAFDLGLVLLVLGTVRLKNYSLLIAVVLGVCLYFGYPFLFYGTAAGSFMLVAAWLLATSNIKFLLDKKAGSLLTIAACLVFLGHSRNDPGGWEFTLIWVACLGGAVGILLYEMALSRGEKSAPVRWIPAQIWYCSGVAVVLLGVLALNTGALRLGGEKRTMISPKLYNLWVQVRELTPSDSLIFTDQTGENPDRLTGWNDLSTVAERQFFISSWSMSPLRANEAARLERLQQNQDVLDGRIAPTQAPLKRSYSYYYAAVSAGRNIPKNAQRIYDNGDYAIYRFNEPSQ